MAALLTIAALAAVAPDASAAGKCLILEEGSECLLVCAPTVSPCSADYAWICIEVYGRIDWTFFCSSYTEVV
jgi:hypothetical protein